MRAEVNEDDRSYYVKVVTIQLYLISQFEEV